MINTLLFCSLLIVSFIPVLHGQKKDLQKLAMLYPFYEKQALESLPGFGTHVTTINTALIDTYVQIIANTLNQKHISLNDLLCIKKIALDMTKGIVYRNGSADSRWRNYAKQAVVYTLLKTNQGQAILEDLILANPLFAQEVEAYTTTL